MTSAPDRRRRAEVDVDGDRLSPVRRRNVSGDAYDALRDLVVSGDLRPGDHLAVRPLTERLGISPTPIRMALAQLARDGLLDLHDRRGYFVPHLEAHEMVDLYEIRACADSIASRRVAALPDRGELVAELRDLVDRQRSAVAACDLRAYGELDVRFHGRIWERAGNRRVTVISGNLLGQLRAANQFSARAPGRLPVALAEHVEIVDALEAGDASRAASATRHHVHQSSLALQSLIGADPVSASG